MSKLYTLQLTDADGNNVWSRQVEEKHVQRVAKFLEKNMGLIMAAQGLVQAANGIEAILSGLEASLPPPPKRRVRGRR